MLRSQGSYNHRNSSNRKGTMRYQLRERVNLAFLAFILVVAPTVEAQERMFEENVDLQPAGRLALEAGPGSVQLTSWDQTLLEVRARIEAPVGVDADAARRAVEGTTIEVRGERRSVRVRAVFGEGESRVHYEIRAPRELDLDLVADRSNTILAGFQGRFFMELDRSNVDLSDITGTIVLELDRGLLRGDELIGELSLDLDRTNAILGGVEVQQASQITTDRGDVVLRLVRAQALRVDTEMTARTDASFDMPETTAAARAGQGGGGPSLRITADRSSLRVEAN